jgi:hypothetical protein
MPNASLLPLIAKAAERGGVARAHIICLREVRHIGRPPEHGADTRIQTHLQLNPRLRNTGGWLSSNENVRGNANLCCTTRFA